MPYSVSIKSPVVDPLSISHAEASSRRPRAQSRAPTPVTTTTTTTTRLQWRRRRRRPRLQDGSDDRLSCDLETTTTTFPGQPVCAPAASWNSAAGRRRRGPPAVPRRADRAAQAAPTCGRTTADASSYLPPRARSVVRDVSSPAFLAIYTGFIVVSLPGSLYFQKDSLPFERFRGTTSAPSGDRCLSRGVFSLRLPGR